MDANETIRLESLKEQAMMDYKRAQLMAYSVNDPKKMPKLEEFYPFMGESVKRTPEEEAQIAMKKDQDLLRLRAEQIKATRARKMAKEKST